MFDSSCTDTDTRSPRSRLLLRGASTALSALIAVLVGWVVIFSPTWVGTP